MSQMSEPSTELVGLQQDKTNRSFEAYSEELEYGYRSVSRAAVLSLVFGLLGLLSWYSPLLLFLCAIGAVFALVAFRNLRKYP